MRERIEGTLCVEMFLGVVAQVPSPDFGSEKLHSSSIIARGSGSRGHLQGKNSKANKKWGFAKSRGTLLGFPIIRIIVYWSPY